MSNPSLLKVRIFRKPEVRLPKELVRLLDQTKLVSTLKMIQFVSHLLSHDQFYDALVYLLACPLGGGLLLFNRILGFVRSSRFHRLLLLFQFHIRLSVLLNLMKSVAGLCEAVFKL